MTSSYELVQQTSVEHFMKSYVKKNLIQILKNPI